VKSVDIVVAVDSAVTSATEQSSDLW